MSARERGPGPESGPINGRRHLWALVAIVVGGAALRFATLSHQSFDHDEAVTAWRVLQPSFAGTMRVVAHTERSPPLYYIFAWLWSKLFGTGEVALRSLSAIFGTLTIPAAYLAARELATRRAGLIAALLVALNPYLIWYSQEARSYALFALFAAWALYFFARALNEQTPRSLALWALTSTLALCSHYFAVFLIVPEGLLLVISIRPRRWALAAVAATGVVGLSLAPLAVGQESGPTNLFRLEPLALRAGQALLDFVVSVEPSPLVGSPAIDAVQILAGLGAAVMLAIAIVIVARRGASRERRAAVRVGVVAALSFGLPVLLAVAGHDFVEPRKVLIGSVVPLLVLAAVGLGARRAGRVGLVGAAAGAVIFTGVLAAVYESGQMQRLDWRGAAAAIGPARQSRLLVVASSGQVPLAYYLHAADFRAHKGRGRIRAMQIDTLGRDPEVDPPGRGFRLVGLQHIAGTFWLHRYQASSPRLVTAAQVSGNRLLNEPSLDLANRVPNPTLVVRRVGRSRGSFGRRSNARSALSSSDGSARRSMTRRVSRSSGRHVLRSSGRHVLRSSGWATFARPERG
jgi:mannosyltransferase